ncbi:hypothetical protein PFUGPA_02119 [Plasmodium falciparum Palo Alto/Uganda]|uniref:Uncharacterized protein n=3 Tax=Plasmodium falciparum TaxID=5833 RepID=W4J1J7_PLAFP|nr:hypothetical protein PFFVO_03664 [Plasmodium falciparum Vietnam Oak-Knoll (FVO)]ETW41564.1 hypothetical protein PFNF135_04211 [Plasmodium falciparum NF135/5.C10]ETW56075.1 hypothetical protein PFUGPA_02119 [Plasmodium falciparum Palo Alto/Uganda]
MEKIMYLDICSIYNLIHIFKYLFKNIFNNLFQEYEKKYIYIYHNNNISEDSTILIIISYSLEHRMILNYITLIKC